jgi:thiol:disulfide interchange protein
MWAMGAVGLLLAVMGQPVRAQFGGLLNPAGGEEKLKVSGQFTPRTGDQPAQLFVTATIKPGWHIYSVTQAPGGPVKTVITLDSSSDYRATGEPVALTPPEKKTDPYVKNVVIEEHHGTVTWRIPLEIASGADPSKLTIKGKVKAQVCDPNTCTPPTDFAFTARLGEAPAGAAAAAAPPPAENVPPLTPGPSPARGEGSNQTAAKPEAGPPMPLEDLPPPGPAAGGTSTAHSAARELGDLAAEAASANELPWRPYTSYDSLLRVVSGSAQPASAASPVVDPPAASNGNSTGAEASLLGQIVFAFFGGMLLNLMPCVLPVIGLKIVSFVEQSGEDRHRALMLNLAYSAGLMSVFLLLASLAVGLGLGWGQQFQSAGFNIFLACLVFAMGLSFLGVWEIPVPGFLGHGAAAAMVEHEGMLAAFLKGVITTVLATPCTGPFMGGALGWAMKQPPLATMSVFLAVGLGMSSPYLLIGAFPQLIRFLPRPGMWMETFKQIMGFVLMGTVIYVLTFIDWHLVVPTVGMFIALWIACWWINRTPPTHEFGLKARAWLEAAATVGLAWVLLFPGTQGLLPAPYTFRGLAEVMEGRFRDANELCLGRRLDDFDRAGYELVKTNRARAPKTVLVDITADWCLTCKTLEATMMNTPEVRRLVAKNGVATLKADYTRMDPEVTRLLNSVKGGGVPVIVIYPAGKPQEPIVFRNGYTTSQILDALQKAGPSKT